MSPSTQRAFITGPNSQDRRPELEAYVKTLFSALQSLQRFEQVLFDRDLGMAFTRGAGGSVVETPCAHDSTAWSRA